MASAWKGKAGDICIVVFMHRRKNAGDPLDSRQQLKDWIDHSYSIQLMVVYIALCP